MRPAILRLDRPRFPKDDDFPEDLEPALPPGLLPEDFDAAVPVDWDFAGALYLLGAGALVDFDFAESVFLF